MPRHEHSASSRSAFHRIDDAPASLLPSFPDLGNIRLRSTPDKVLSGTLDRLNHAFGMNGMKRAMDMMLSLQSIDVSSGVRGLSFAPTPGPPTTMIKPKL